VLLVVLAATSCNGAPEDVAEDHIETGRVKAALSDDFTVPDEVMRAATEGLNKWKNRLTDLSSAFANIKDIRLGEPYLVYDVPIESVVNKEKLTEDDFVKTNTWFFPLVGDGKYLLWIKVRKTEEGWIMAGIGGNSGRLQSLEADLQKQKTTIRRSLVRAVSLNDFIVIRKGDASTNRDLLSADFYPYGLTKEDTNVATTAQQPEKPIKPDEMLFRMKQTARINQIKGVR
jgi:hypothetical protein